MASEQFPILTHERLCEVLEYDPATGFFRWKARIARRCHVGDVAGGVNDQGYHHIRVDGRAYKAHRLAWFYVHGSWPAGLVDHIDGVCSNNQIANLREATRSQNLANSRPYRRNGRFHKGVRRRRNGTWDARISHDKKCHFLGCFKTEAEAIAAYSNAAIQFFGPFARSVA